MRRTKTWWRNLGGLVAACVLALLFVAPMVSIACVCDDNARIVGVETSVVGAQAAQSDHSDHEAPCDAVCCVSGHCHHGGALLDTAIATVPTPAPVDSEHAMVSAHMLASRTISGPDRPPRA